MDRLEFGGQRSSAVSRQWRDEQPKKRKPRRGEAGFSKGPDCRGETIRSRVEYLLDAREPERFERSANFFALLQRRILGSPSGICLRAQMQRRRWRSLSAGEGRSLTKLEPTRLEPTRRGPKKRKPRRGRQGFQKRLGVSGGGQPLYVENIPALRFSQISSNGFLVSSFAANLRPMLRHLRRHCDLDSSGPFVHFPFTAGGERDDGRAKGRGARPA